MTALDQLNAYLKRLETRLRLFAVSRGAAIVAALALGLTLLMVWISNHYVFAQHVVLPLRILLFVILAVATSFALAIPLLKLNRRHVTRLAEHRIPTFEERLLTISEKPDRHNPFTELVAEDALRIAREHEPEQMTPTRLLFAFFGSGTIAALVLIWLIAGGPGYWGYGASLLWTGSANPGKRPLYDIGVQPGNKTIRRRSNQLITAELFGFSAHNVRLHARAAGGLKWEETTMQPKPDGNAYQFLFAGVSDPVEYYVQADAAQSKHFTINVKDLPGVKKVRVAVHFPSGLRLKDVVEDPGGDLRAVQGSQADISVLTDRFLDHGLLVMENGSKIELKRGNGNWLTAHIPIEKDGSYHVAALDSGEVIRISDDYFIEAKKDEPPSIRILRPGHDPRVSPIEEVPVTIDASDDFGVENIELHYSVNGGAEQVMPLLKTKGVKEAEGHTTLYFENFKVVPGDLVSLYATARDANKTSKSDIIFAQAEPFDFKFSQSQQAGGAGMGMGNQDSDISERQKQIIAATWNELKDDNKKTPAGLQEDAHFLSDLEGKLSLQAKTLSDRMANRELGTSGSSFENFSKLMTQASSEMGEAVSQLKPGKWHDSLPPEQKALQSLLRAEALFRDIQVAFGQSGGGMGGGGAQRDLARMFDLELDTTKNQYETGQSPAASSNDQQKAIDDAFQRLQALAQRQQELAAQHEQQQAMEQRWQEEQLRREAEELRQQMQQLAQNSQQGQQSSSPQQNGQQSSSSSSSSQGSSSQKSSSQKSGQSGHSEQMAEALRQTMNALQRAEDEMRKAVSDHDATAEQRASAQLREAQNLLNNMLHQQAGTSASDMAQRAQEIASAQRDLANRMKQMYGMQGSNGRRGNESAESGAESMPEMNDPNSMRFGYGYRRRWQQDLQPTREATEQEKALAADKDKLARQLEQLEKQMQQEADSMAGTQPEASSKMRKALSDAEQKELALRMEKNAEWMRQGYGDRNAGMEDSVTEGLDELSRQLRDMQDALKSGNRGLANGENDKEAQTLAEIRGLQQELERRADQREQGQQGQPQSRQGQPGGQQGGQSGQQRAQSGQQGGQQTQSGAWSPQGGGGTGIDRRGVQDAIGQLNWLRGHIDPQDRALKGYVDGALGSLYHLTGAQDGLLDSRIGRDAAAKLERLELELTKRLSQQQAEGARIGAPEASPEKYRDAVAEYFKRLSEPK